MEYSNFSLVVPLYNEAEVISDLVKEIFIVLENCKNFEIILVNDNSTDDTKKIITNLSINNSLKIINNKKNFGQSYSISIGIKKSKYDIIITMDGDGQNNPNDIIPLLDSYLQDKQIKLVGGIRFKRQDNQIKKITSKIANSIRKSIFRDGCDDTGCSLKVFDKNIFLIFPYFNGIHRFLPALFTGYGYKTKFINVDHRIRKFGYSKYGTFDRLIRGIRDIIKVLIILNKEKNK